MMTKPHISELELETTTLALWHEFLAGYFNGQAHAVGANLPAPFPKCELRFQQSPLEQPMAVPCISLIWAAPSTVRKCWETVGGTRQHVVHAPVRFTFLIRAFAAANELGNARQQCTRAAERLAGLLANNAATRPLAQKGIRRLRPGLPQSVQDDKHILRRLDVGATLRYPILSQV